MIGMTRAPRLLAAAAALIAAALVPVAARADDTTTINVVGTSDVYDSNLVQSVIKPGFEKAYPKYTLNYISKGTGAAIAYAEAGSADAMIVHAASLENQFVASGYSLEKYGRAIFWGDYVLLGPKSDPVGVKTSDPHDIVGAFEKIAAAGAKGTANFVSRGGTPGTTVQEHAIWALSTGTTLCAMSDTNGGGSSPSTTTGNCPSTISYPNWYHATGLTQGPNITAANTCNFDGGNCYVLTDRGTYAYLKSQGDASNLQIVARDNSATATGGSTLLVNSFHAYALNPAKFTSTPSVTIHTAGATALLDWITSTSGQKAIGNYLNADKDAPFIPDAAPKITVTSKPSGLVSRGSKVTVKATVANVVPGTPALSGVTVALKAVPTTTPTATPVTVARATTNAKGMVTLSYTPSRNYVYSLATSQITKIENSTLDPVFGDLLAPSTTSVGTVRIGSSSKITGVAVSGRTLTITGRVSPSATGKLAHVNLYLQNSSNKAGYVKVGTATVKPGQSTFRYRYTVKQAGRIAVKGQYVNTGYIASSTSGPWRVTVR